MPAGTIIILGHVELRSGDKPAGLRRQLRKALALMVAARGRRVRRQEISAAVWDNEDSDVRTLMWSLRRALRDCNSGFDVPPDKGKEGSYRLVAAEPGSLDDAVDAFRFLALTRQGQALLDGGEETAAVGLLTAAAALWGGEPFAGLWPDGPPQPCRRLRAELEQAGDQVVRTLAETALRQGAPYRAARACRGQPIGERAADHDTGWLADFLIAMHDRPGGEEAGRLLAARRAPDSVRRLGERVVARADDLLMLAEAGIDVHRPLAAERRPPVAGSPPVMVGRDAEMAAFRRVLAGMGDGRPATVLACGASGRGKSRLAGEFAAAAAAAGVPVVLVDADEAGDLRPWQEIGRKLWPAACRDIGQGRDLQAPWLTLGQRRALLDFVAPRAGASAPLEPDQAQQARFAEIAGALSLLARNVAARTGLVVSIDNADRLSDRSRDLLSQFLASLRDAPVSVVLLGRDEPGGPVPPAEDTAPAAEDTVPAAEGTVSWAEAAVRAGAAPVRLLLGPLPPDAIGGWLRQVRGQEPTPEEIARVARATGGEPVRIGGHVAGESVVAPWSREHAAADDDGGVPSAWLAAAAITAAGLAIDTALVASMLDLTDEQADREELRARRTAWIDTSAGVCFLHGSHRDAVVARLDADPSLRRALHARAFTALTERVPAAADPDPSLPVRIAEHALRADRDLSPDDAARAFLAAAQAERASGEAAESWARAGIMRGPGDQAMRAGLHLALGDALDQRGAVTAADREYQLAFDIAADRPLVRAEALVRLARRWTDPGKVDWYLLRGLQDGIAALEGHDDELAVALRLQLTAHLARKSTLAVPVLGTEADEIRQGGVAIARAALGQLAENALPPAAACEVLNECRWALYDYDPPAETIRLSQRLGRVSLLARSPYYQRQALMTLAVDQLRLGQVTEAQGTLLAHERSMPDSHAARWLQLTMETAFDLWFGRFAAAEDRLFGVAAPLVAQAHAEQARVADTLQQTWQGQVYWLRRERGDILSRSDPEVYRQIEGHAYFPIWRAALALTRCDEGDLAGAAAHVRALDEEYHRFAAFPPHGWSVSVAAMLAEACLALSPQGGHGSREEPPGDLLPGVAAALRAILGRHAGEVVLAGWPSVPLGPAERFCGLLALADGDYAEALRLFDAASGKVAAAPPHAARLQVDRARALIGRLSAGRGAGGRVRLGYDRADRDVAVRLLDQAAATARRLGMGSLAAEAGQLLSRC
jgi:hypothetical protein